MSICGVLFDFDGVIVDSISVHKRAWAKAYEIIFDSKLPNYSTENLTGKSSLKIAEFLCVKINQIERSNELANLKLKILLHDSPLPKLLPGVHDFFEYLNSINLPFGIASNAPRKYIEKTLNDHKLKVSEFVGFDEIKNPKPAPDPYIVCAKKCRIEEDNFNRVMVFEDSVPGIKSAIAAGMIPIGVETTHMKDELLNAGAKRCCSDLSVPYQEKWLNI